jgi:hypothetical protein
MPKGARYVGRPTKWGNRFRPSLFPGATEDPLVLFRRWLMLPEQAWLREEARRELRGRPLACWCALDRACHADIWLEIANA